MTPDVLSNYGLRVDKVVKYLQQNHWISIDCPNQRLLLFEQGVDDLIPKLIQVDDLAQIDRLLQQSVSKTGDIN